MKRGGRERDSSLYAYVCDVSPAYGLRSYLYILLHASVGKLLQVVGVEAVWGRIGLFYGIRLTLGVVCATAECALVRSVRRRLGASVAGFSLLFLMISPGMFHAGVR
jgi:alpha-1,2-mannosyltransferase